MKGLEVSFLFFSPLFFHGGGGELEKRMYRGQSHEIIIVYEYKCTVIAKLSTEDEKSIEKNISDLPRDMSKAPRHLSSLAELSPLSLPLILSVSVSLTLFVFVEITYINCPL